MLGNFSWKEILVILLVIYFGIPLCGQLVDIFTPQKVKKERERKRNTKFARWKRKQEQKIRIAIIAVMAIIVAVYYLLQYLQRG